MLEKLPLRFEALWLASLKLHVASAALTFPLCIALMTRWLRRRAAWHRWLGRVTSAMILVLLVPSGVVLASEAKGGTLGTLGFLLSAAIVTYCSVHAVRAARRRDLVSHAHAMRHVVGQMSVAVTSRAMIVGLDALGMDPDLAYIIALWVPVLGTVATVELLRLPSFDVSTLTGGTAVKYLRWFLSCVLVSALQVSPASADEQSIASWAKNRLQLGLVRMLANLDRQASRFSRGRPPPSERRVRILQTSTTRDQLGRQFIRFAIDVRYGDSEWKSAWKADDVVGCIYMPTGDMYVKRGDKYHPAALLQGKRVTEVSGACTEGARGNLAADSGSEWLGAAVSCEFLAGHAHSGCLNSQA